MSNISKKDRQEELAALKARLQKSIQTESNSTRYQSLQEQMDVLNLIFKRMLADADQKYDALIQYGLALRAQNQFRQTLQMAEQIEGCENRNNKTKPE